MLNVWEVFRVLLAGRAALVAENLALRHQVAVLRRSVKRSRLRRQDRILWAWLSRIWTDWRSSLVIVKPDTVVSWHRQGFRLYWRWKSRHRGDGRPAVPRRVRDLIRHMSKANSLWGAPRIHGELLKLGIEVSPGNGVQVHGPSSQATVTIVANVSQQPCESSCPSISSRCPR